MSQVYKQDNMTIHNADCMEIMAEYEDNYFDLAVVDPPYGENALDGSRTARIYGINRADNWDCYKPPKEYFIELMRVSKNQIIWGGNYFIDYLYSSKCFLVWNKPSMAGMHTMSFGEFAWTSFNKPSKIKHLESDKKNRMHPTQKPIKLYNWIYANYAEEGQKILDTHGGSFSNAIAAHYAKMGEFVGCELDEDYFKGACERIRKETRQMELF